MAISNRPTAIRFRLYRLLPAWIVSGEAKDLFRFSQLESCRYKTRLKLGPSDHGTGARIFRAQGGSNLPRLIAG
jgi:hypothetical protein